MWTHARGWTRALLSAAVASCAASAPAAGPADTPQRPPLKQRLQDGTICRGAFLGLLAGGPAAQFLAGQGFDFFILDLEHYTFDETTVREMIIAARAAGIAPLLRVGEPNQQVTRWLDAGAEGIVIPTVETRRQAEALVKYGRYPPQGERGASSMNGHTDFARVPDLPRFLERRNREILLLVMIETPKGQERVEEILSTPGIDGAIMGTGDYSQAIGLAGQPDHPEVWKAAERLISVCRQKKKLVSVPIRRPENVDHWVKEGLTMLTFVDLALISQGIQLSLGRIDQARGVTPGGARP
jgi:2-dehydro-3-deoxyglucarate aldolase/4-hydroxy-2-oxoheptanedioate aldolase